ncbi:MAG: hypothetical protein CSA36_01630 [Draconibacterium sp.]|nr:MAG: hypothetical protein CSA36_01630 [Draconibacterium sp.]
MLRIGDKVKFLNDVGGGIVTGFIDKVTAKVKSDDGFEIPYPVSQLVNVTEMEREEKAVISRQEDFSTPEAESTEPQKQEGVVLDGKDSPDFYFCFVPDDAKNPLAGETTLYLVNDANFTLLYQYSHFQNGKNNLVKYGSVACNSKVILETMDRSNLADLPEFVFQLLYFRDGEKELHEAVAKRFKVSPVKFYKEKSFQSNPFFGENAMVLQITPNVQAVAIDKMTEKTLQEKFNVKGKTVPLHAPPKKKPSDLVEVDLHIQELLDNTNGLSSREILEIQMEKVASEMNEAIRSHVKRIVFIHGVGHGVLKQEIAKLLKSRFSKYHFQDASFKEYGYGATMVILRRGK